MAEWQPIETAPKDGTRILLWIVSDTRIGYRLAVEHKRNGLVTYSNEEWFVAEDMFRFMPPEGKPQPSHWMPLPKPPTN